MSIAASTFKADIDHTKDLSDLQDKPAVTKTGNEKERWQKYYTFWKKCKNAIETDPNKADYEKWSTKKLRKAQLAKLRLNAERAFAFYAQAQTAKNTVHGERIQTLLNNAAFGAGNTEATTNYGPGNREAICSWTTTPIHLKAGSSLKLDLLCLCAYDHGDTANGGKVCGPDPATSGSANTDNWEGNTKTETNWTPLKTACQKRKTQVKLTLATVGAVRLRLAELLGRQTPATAKAHKYVLGSIMGNGDEGCKGDKDNNGGRCVKYKESDVTDPAKGIEWLRNLRDAALAKEAAADANKEMTAITRSLQLLNDSTNLLFDEDETTPAAPPTPNPSTAGSKAQEEKQKEQCEAIKVETECKGKKPLCEWKGKNDEDGEHCKLNATHVEQQATQAGKNGENEEKKTDKCGLAKTPEECAAVKGDIPKDKKAVCGWIEGKCQDSSFLVNKKSSLISVSFMSLVSFKHFNDSYSIFRNL
ncbi:Trypanosomal VSG domain/Trypanosome variant surface glycoprotein C-terminal domain containing protein, putative [Trypanosoma equiperdum]|uniref:Trypanosomal VSG domain/Trypanosome variant surface glycoprotein C-terminal domain containing protein, putative n=1 Tax=Trypanosoma equiperdum TaxID=5694 RepID=A0A1G4IEB0_TRYEQ|nr:Trypanosomal VSG domain/Trypanosome variant surface glycoprotein C-terminal domain containing protein, putative [Trypanosoma equiperdum]